MPRTKGEMTKLVNAKTSSDSLRATIPSFIVKSLHLEAGDKLEWEIESIEQGSVKITIRRNQEIEHSKKTE